jgi:hypothetical protein
VTATGPWATTLADDWLAPSDEATHMRLTQRVRKILDWYESDNPGTKTNLARILGHGKLGGTGCIIGRNTFQRPKDEALAMLAKIIDIQRGEKPEA